MTSKLQRETRTARPRDAGRAQFPSWSGHLLRRLERFQPTSPIEGSVGVRGIPVDHKSGPELECRDETRRRENVLEGPGHSGGDPRAPGVRVAGAEDAGRATERARPAAQADGRTAEWSGSDAARPRP